MMKGVMMAATVSVSNVPATGQTEPAVNMTEASTQVVTSLVDAGKQASTSPYTVTVRKIEPIAGGNQVRVTFFVTGDDEPAHDFTETGRQVVAALLDAGIHTNVSGTGTTTVEKIEAVEGGDDDSDDDSDTDALSGLVANADSPATPTGGPTQSQTTESAIAGEPFDDDRPQPHVRPPDAQSQK